jgi:hypothetical protein
VILALLMDQCSWHDIPLAFSVILTNQPGHDLNLELDTRLTTVLTGWRLGDNLTSKVEIVQSH